VTYTRLHIESLAAEIEQHVAQAGWDQVPRLFAFASTAEIAAAEPAVAAQLGITSADAVSDQALTPIEQDELPDGDIDAMLAQIAWPDSVVGCALSHEIVFLPPEAEQGLTEHEIADTVAEHPQRREARLTVAVLRSGLTTSLLRLRPASQASAMFEDDTQPGEPDTDDLLVGEELAPNLVAALLATFE
jgi:hypothetical protein